MIQDRTRKLAEDIRRTYGAEPPHLLCVLKVCLCADSVVVDSPLTEVQGAHMFFTDLTRYLGHYHQFRDVDHPPFTFDFIRVKSYDGIESSGSGTVLVT